MNLIMLNKPEHLTKGYIALMKLSSCSFFVPTNCNKLTVFLLWAFTDFTKGWAWRSLGEKENESDLLIQHHKWGYHRYLLKKALSSEHMPLQENCLLVSKSQDDKTHSPLWHTQGHSYIVVEIIKSPHFVFEENLWVPTHQCDPPAVSVEALLFTASTTTPFSWRTRGSRKIPSSGPACVVVCEAVSPGWSMHLSSITPCNICCL